jgi:hypothetical protein
MLFADLELADDLWFSDAPRYAEAIEDTLLLQEYEERTAVCRELKETHCGRIRNLRVSEEGGRHREDHAPFR